MLYGDLLGQRTLFSADWLGFFSNFMFYRHCDEYVQSQESHKKVIGQSQFSSDLFSLNDEKQKQKL